MRFLTPIEEGGSKSKFLTIIEKHSKSIPDERSLNKFKGSDECYELSRAVSKKFPQLEVRSGFFIRKDGYPADHSWCIAEDGTIIDTTAVQFGIGYSIIHRGDPNYLSYVSYEDNFEKAKELENSKSLIEKLSRRSSGPESNVDKFFEWWGAHTQENPLNWRQRIFCNCLFEVAPGMGDDGITLNDIVSLGKGSGTIAMKEFLKVVDSFHLSVDLYALAYSNRGMPTERLRDWYESFGFEVSEEKENWKGEVGYEMVRGRR